MGYGAVKYQWLRRGKVLFDSASVLDMTRAPLGLEAGKKYALTVDGTKYKVTSSASTQTSAAGILSAPDASTGASTEEPITVAVRLTNLLLLGVLTLEEYSGFFETSLDLDGCAYLTDEMRTVISGISASQRRTHRVNATMKLNVTEMFTVSLIHNGVDYSDQLSWRIIDWGVGGAQVDEPPYADCTVELTWIGSTTATASNPSVAYYEVGIPQAGLSTVGQIYYPANAANVPAVPAPVLQRSAVVLAAGGVTITETEDFCFISTGTAKAVKVETA